MSEEIKREEEIKETAVAEEIVRPYTLRKLKNGDLWTVVRILGKILPDDLKMAFVQVMSGEKTVEQVGATVICDMATMITQNMHKARTEVDEFCADLAGITVEELNEEMEFGTTPLIIVDICEDAKKTTFFKVLSRFFS